MDKDDERFPVFPPVLREDLSKALGKISTVVAEALIHHKVNQWSDVLDREVYSAITLTLDAARRDRNNPIPHPNFNLEKGSEKMPEKQVDRLLLIMAAKGAFADNKVSPEDIEPEIYQKEQEARRLFDIVFAAVQRSSNGMPSAAAELEGCLDEALNWAKKEITFFDHDEDNIRQLISNKYANDAVKLTEATLQSTLLQKILTPPPQVPGRAPA